MRKVFVTAILAVIGLGSFAVFGSSTGFVKTLLDSVQHSPITRAFTFGPEIQSGSVQPVSEVTVSSKTDQPMTAEQSEVPEVVLWSVIFTLPERLDNAAHKAREMGEDDSLWTNYFVRQAKLSTSSNQILRETASRCLSDIAPLDEQARSIALELRGRSSQPSGLSEPPAELMALQKQKEEMVLRNRDEFRAVVGEEEYAKFTHFLVTEFAKGFVRQDPRSNLPAQQEGEINNFTPFPTVRNGGNQ